MQPTDRDRNRNGEAQERLHLHRSADQAMERFAFDIIEYEERSPMFANKLQRANCPRAVIQFTLQFKLVDKAIEGVNRWVVDGRQYDQDSVLVVGAFAPPSEDDTLPVLPGRLKITKTTDYVCRG